MLTPIEDKGVAKPIATLDRRTNRTSARVTPLQSTNITPVYRYLLICGLPGISYRYILSLTIRGHTLYRGLAVDNTLRPRHHQYVLHQETYDRCCCATLHKRSSILLAVHGLLLQLLLYLHTGIYQNMPREHISSCIPGTKYGRTELYYMVQQHSDTWHTAALALAVAYCMPEM